jgi:hypothetical protein
MSSGVPPELNERTIRPANPGVGEKAVDSLVGLQYDA